MLLQRPQNALQLQILHGVAGQGLVRLPSNLQQRKLSAADWQDAYERHAATFLGLLGFQLSLSRYHVSIHIEHRFQRCHGRLCHEDNLQCQDSLHYELPEGLCLWLPTTGGPRQQRLV